jgi:hypothetical protein
MTSLIFADNENNNKISQIVQKTNDLKKLEPIEEYLHHQSPLPINYDLNRPQPWYFSEYSYTEFMGGIAISPMSDEIATRHILHSMKFKSSFDAESIILHRLKENDTLDKYTTLQEPSGKYAEFNSLVILPGSNIMHSIVSKEKLAEVMWSRDDVNIKPHPLTTKKQFYELQKEFGVHRVFHPLHSGWKLLERVNEIYTTSTTELAMYAVLLNKRVKSIGNVFYERTGAYYPIFRNIVNLSPTKAKNNLLKILNSDRSGVVFIEDLQYEKKIDLYFNSTMKMRTKYKPLVINSFEYPKNRSAVEEKKADK